MLKDLMEPLLGISNPGDIPGGDNPPALEPIMEAIEVEENLQRTESQREAFARHRLLSALVLPNVDASASLQAKLQARISDFRYWINLVSRLGFDPSVYQHSLMGGAPSLETLSRYFDSTQLGMLRVFHLFDKDHDQTVTNSEVAHGLRQQGLYTLQGKEEADEAFSQLFSLISAEDGLAHPPEFLAALRNLRLAAIVHDRQTSVEIAAGEEIRINLHEYREDQLYSACPMEQPVAFLFKPNTLTAEIAQNPNLHSHVSASTHLTGGAAHHVRWLHLHEPGRKAVLGLAVKYGLDPRFVLDVFTLWREQAKVDQVSTYDYSATSATDMPEQIGAPSVDRPLWFFVVVPVLRLSERSRETLRPYQAWRRSVMRQRSSRGLNGTAIQSGEEAPSVEVVVEHCNLAMFVSGVAEGGTVLSFSSEWVELVKLSTVAPMNQKTKSKKSCWPFMRGSKNVSNDRRESTAGGIGDIPVVSRTAQSSLEAQMSMFAKVLSQIRTSYSRLRTGDAHTFLLKVLCDLTEDYLLIAQAYDACLLILQKRLDRAKDKLHGKDVRRVQKAVMQLSQLYRIVRPVATLADTFTSRQQWSGDAMLYVSDIRSNVSRFLEDVSASKENAKSISDQYHQYAEAKTSSVLYALTLVTTVFVPGQFLTGIYGMNFQDENGVPTIPELTWEHGYLFFWCLLIVITTITFIFYRRQRWI
jgi:Mg2+ and Co2+ transporter CorA